LYILTPYSEFARSIIWGDSDIRDYERFPFRTIGNAPPVFHFSTIQLANHNNKSTKISNSNSHSSLQLLFDYVVPNNVGDGRDGTERGRRLSFEFLALTGTNSIHSYKE
jgi:hypothetical protein